MNLRVKAKKARGIALIMVMLVVTAMAFLAFALATSMKVETTLARNSSWDMELEWLGRSGIELAKYYLVQPKKGPQVDAANQLWAGGTAETNDALAGLSLKDNHLGHGTFSVTITDEDRKFNINVAALAPTPEILNQAMFLIGVDGAEASGIVNAISDWVDKDDKPRVGSTDTETSYYESLPQPHLAKNGYIDDLTELMSIKGITPAMYFGPGNGGNTGNAAQQMFTQSANRFNRRRDEEPPYAAGFVDLFTSVGVQVNFNFASATVMQLFPAIEEGDAQAIIEWRSGDDGVEGNEDDRPFQNKDEIAKLLLAKGHAFASEYVSKSPYIGVVSSTFQVQVDAQIDNVKRTYYALLRRTGQNQIQLLYMYWR